MVKGCLLLKLNTKNYLASMYFIFTLEEYEIGGSFDKKKGLSSMSCHRKHFITNWNIRQYNVLFVFYCSLSNFFFF